METIDGFAFSFGSADLSWWMSCNLSSLGAQRRANILIYRAIWRNYGSLIRDKFLLDLICTPFSQRRKMILGSFFFFFEKDTQGDEALDFLW